MNVEVVEFEGGLKGADSPVTNPTTEYECSTPAKCAEICGHMGIKANEV